MNKKKLRALATKVAAAATRMNAAYEALEGADPDDENVDLDQLQRDFDDAKAEHRDAKAAHERGKEVLEARENAPVIADDPADREERDDLDPAGTTQITREPRTYERHKRTSYFLDLARDKVLGDTEARDRLDTYSREVRDELAAREKTSERRLNEVLDRVVDEARLPEAQARALRSSMVEKRALNRTDGTGGDFVPPLYLLDEYAELARAGRPFADACRNIPLPAGTDGINVPKISTGTATGVQAADNAAVTSTDLTTATISAPVRTIAGQQDVGLQLLEQSPVAFDDIVFGDLMADLEYRTEDQVINGTGSSGQVLGILNVSGINPISYTDASPTVPELYPKVADGLSQARTARKRPITHGWIAPRRGYWITAALDSNGRPLVPPQIQGPFNALGLRLGTDAAAQDEDFVLNMLVPQRMTDAIPTGLGAGTNEDRIILSRMFDHLLFEGILRARALTEVLSGTLGVRLQVYRYAAFTAARFPAATSVIAGTGLVTPTF